MEKSRPRPGKTDLYEVEDLPDLGDGQITSVRVAAVARYLMACPRTAAPSTSG